ncbi:opsin 7, group member a [Osmerus mordax]|uniref:opsin 7, group member a n=1 Tax=Osmerus mordax TaxID=8014 RepID=UPI003510C886
MGWLADNTSFHSNISEAADLAVAVVYSIFGVCSLLGNTMLLYVSYKKKQLLKPAEFFIINLAVSDLGMTLSLYPLAVTSSIYHRWLYGKTVCLIYAFCGVLFGICSLTTLTILSTVCCLKVCYPLYGNRFGPDHGRILIACAWAYALVFACSPLAHWGAYGPEPYGTACCIDWRVSGLDAGARSYTVALFVCCYALPCAVITSSYTQILATVRESRRAVERHVSAQTRMGNIQTIIVKLSVAVCIGFFAAWSPYAMVSMWAAFGHMDAIPPMAFAIPAMFAKSSTLYNPLVYLLLKPNFRHLLSKDLLSLRRACLRRCSCVHRLRRLSCRSVAAVGLRPRVGAAASDSAPSRAVLGSSHCACERCRDPFECFKQYPRRCHINVNTVQLSLMDRVAPPPAPGPAPLARTHPASKKSVRVVVRGKKSAEVDGLEVTLETVPAHLKTVAP